MLTMGTMMTIAPMGNEGNDDHLDHDDPVNHDDHLDHEDHLNHDDYRICNEVGG